MPEADDNGAARGLRSGRGFTIVELIVVISVVGILAAIVGPRFVGTDTFRGRGFYDEAQGIIRFAHKTAIAWRSTIHVCVTATAVSASPAAGCASPLVNPTTGNALAASAPNGVTLTPASFSFDAAGRPNPNSTVTITLNTTVAGDPARQIVVEAETGYVHP